MIPPGFSECFRYLLLGRSRWHPGNQGVNPVEDDWLPVASTSAGLVVRPPERCNEMPRLPLFALGLRFSLGFFGFSFGVSLGLGF